MTVRKKTPHATPALIAQGLNLRQETRQLLRRAEQYSRTYKRVLAQIEAACPEFLLSP